MAQYLVEAWPTSERGDAIDRGEGPGAVFGKIQQRFKPQSMWGDPTRRHLFMVVELKSEAEVAELMYVLSWFTGNDPKITQIIPVATYGEAMERAKKITSPP